MSLPLVITTEAQSITPTSASLVGSANPNGDAGTWGQTNLVTDPSFAYDTLGIPPSTTLWAIALDAPLTKTDFVVTGAWASTGSRSLHVKLTHDGTSTAANGDVLTGTLPAVPNKPYAAQVDINVLQNPAAGLVLGLTFFDSNLLSPVTILSPTVHGPNADGTGIVTLTLSGTSSVNAAFVKVFVRTASSVANEVIEYYADGAMLVQDASIVAYGDGNLPGWAWLSTPGASASQRYGTWYWFAWDPSPVISGGVLTYANVTPTFPLGSGSVPIAVSAGIQGLTPDVTYHFAIVARNAIGTIYGGDQTFIAIVPAEPITAARPIVPYQQYFAMPHVHWPFTMKPTGLVVSEQDSIDEIVSCVTTIAVCPEGSCSALPALGIPDFVFAETPLDPSLLVESLQNQEPRATEQAIVDSLIDPDLGEWRVSLLPTPTA